MRVTCGSRHEAVELEKQLEAEGYRPIRQWKHLIVGTDTREDADALAARLHGEVETGRRRRVGGSDRLRRRAPVRLLRLSAPAQTMTPDDLDPLEQHLLAALDGARAGRPRPATRRDAEAEALWRAQIESRHCDLAARWLQKERRSFYSIGSAGHESNAAVALALRPTDPALLHYRSGAFYLARAAQAGRDGVPDVMLGVAAAIDEPIAGGRHKVFGHHELAVIPQTSTIASHLPRAVGVAIAIDRARKLGVACRLAGRRRRRLQLRRRLAEPRDRAGRPQHDGARGAPAPARAAALRLRGQRPRDQRPLTRRAGSRARSRAVPTSATRASTGDDPGDACSTRSRELADWVRETRRPGRAPPPHRALPRPRGSDVEAAYRSPPTCGPTSSATRCSRPAAWLVAAGLRTGGRARGRSTSRRGRGCATIALAAARRPQLETRRRGDAAARAPHRRRPWPRLARSDAAAREPAAEPLTLALAINGALADVLERHPETLLFGEDVAAKGGVYGVTRGLHARFGAGRVFDTLLDETSILGLALGAAVSGFVPLPEIQYLAYLHNAEDQLRGEAATLQFFSQGHYRNGMVVRIAGYGYQKGFGGHFHNDDSVAVLRDIPGLVIASPARPDDAAAMLRTCVAAAKVDGSVCAFLEPIALYHTRDLYEEGDGVWLAAPTAGHVPLGSARTYGDGRDLTILTWGNGLLMSLRVARRLEQRGIEARVVDLRWLAPLPIEDIAREAVATQRVLVVDETRRTGGVSEGIIAMLIDAGYDGQLGRVTSKDSFVPLGDAANLVLLSEDEIEAAALALV